MWEFLIRQWQDYRNRCGRLIFRGKAKFAQSIRLWVDSGATLTLGENFYCNKNCLLRAYDDISFGRDVLMGWDISVNTADGHTIYEGLNPQLNHAPITIGNHIWIASHVIIGKGARLPDNSVIAQRSIVTKVFQESNVLIGGTPARILKSGIDWRK